MAVTATTIINAQLKAEEMWKDSALMKAKISHSDTAVAVLKNQTPRLKILEDKNKDYVARVQWIDPCIGGVQDCTPSCTISGSTVSTSAQDYALNICKQTVPISIGEEVWRTNQYDQAEAIALYVAQNKKALDEYWSQQILAFLHANASVNFFPGTYTYNGGTTYVPTNGYNVALMPYLELVANQNQMSDTYKISDVDMYIPWRNAVIDSGNQNGSGDGMRADYISKDLTFDLWNFAKAGITEDMFIIDRGAMAMVTKARFSRTPEYIGGTVAQWRWSETSNVLPGVEYDFYMQETCNAAYSGTQEDVVTNIKAKTRGGIFLNPLGCSITMNGVTGQSTGIISITNGTYVAP